MEGTRYPGSLRCKRSHSSIVRSIEELFSTTESLRPSDTRIGDVHIRCAPSSSTSGFSVAWRRHRHAGIAVSERCHGEYLPARMSFARSLKRQMSFHAAYCATRRTRGEDKEKWLSSNKHRVSLCARVDGARGAAFREAPTRVGEMNAHDMNATRIIQKQDKYRSISKDRTQSWRSNHGSLITWERPP